MIEGDPGVVEWQVDCETNHVQLVDKAPDGFVAAGPWFPFAVVTLNDRGDGDCACTYYRRPLRKADDAQWIPLGDLPPGALFEAKTGERGVRLAVPADFPECARVAWLSDGATATQTVGFPVRRLALP